MTTVDTSLLFATTNVKDFEGFGFSRVWNPLEET